MLSDHPVLPILLSTDMEASRTFYRDLLGMELVREDVIDGEVDRLVFRTGGTSLFAVSHSTVGTADTQTQMAWRVADLRAEVAELRARGVQIEEYTEPDPVTVDGIGDVGHSWAAWIIDPSRNCIALVEPKA